MFLWWYVFSPVLYTTLHCHLINKGLTFFFFSFLYKLVVQNLSYRELCEEIQKNLTILSNALLSLLFFSHANNSY